MLEWLGRQPAQLARRLCPQYAVTAKEDPRGEACRTSINQSLGQSIDQSLGQSNNQSIGQSIHQSTTQKDPLGERHADMRLRSRSECPGAMCMHKDMHMHMLTLGERACHAHAHAHPG